MKLLEIESIVSEKNVPWMDLQPILLWRTKVLKKIATETMKTKEHRDLKKKE